MKVFIICPTYRDRNSNNNIRYFGIVSLLKQIKEQNGNHIIKLAVVDSSYKTHDFFKEHNNMNSNNFLYFHINDRNKINKQIKNNFGYACSFLLNNNEINNCKWQKIVKMNIAWDRFFPWEDNYPATNSIYNQIYSNRPTIGMMRNFAIAALEEKFGESDLIVYADDDDIRNQDYIDNLVISIGNYDFTRMFKYYTFVFDTNQWGEYNVNFIQDINNNWLPSDDEKSVILKNNLKNSIYKTTIGKKYSKPICLAFSPIASVGALHCFRFSLWKQSIMDFGGIPITSTCEDHLFYINCQKLFGNRFKAIDTKVAEPCFIRTSCGNNMSVIEWTKDLQEHEILNWAVNYITEYKNVLKLNKNDLAKYCYNNYSDYIL